MALNSPASGPDLPNTGPDIAPSTPSAIEQQALTRRAAMTLNMAMQSGNPQQWAQARESWRRLASAPRTKEQTTSIIQNVLLSQDEINALRIPKNALRTGGDGLVDIEGYTHVTRGSDEVKYLNDIKMRLRNTANKSEALHEKRKGYLAVENGTYVITRAKIQADLDWLSDAKRMGPNATPERREVFTQYYNLLSRLIVLNPPKDEAKYMQRNRNIAATKSAIENVCRDKNSSMGNIRMTGLVALAGIGALLSFMDFRKGEFSVLTAIVIGGALYLGRGGSKYDFLANDSFARVARDKMDEKMAAKLQNLPSKKLTYIIKTMDDANMYDHKKEVDNEIVEQLTNPTKMKSGKSVPQAELKIPKDIAEAFLGMHPGDVSRVLNGIKNTAKDRDRKVVLDFAKAHHDGRGEVRRDLEIIEKAAPGFGVFDDDPNVPPYTLGAPTPSSLAP